MDKMKRLTELGTATVYEASGREGLIDMPLHQILPGSRVAGPACTVQMGQDDNIMAHACIEHIRPGEIVVLAMPEANATALIGDLLVTQMQVAGAAGVILNGALRDVEECRALGLPIWSAFIRVRGMTKKRVGQINVPVIMGGAKINAGDIVLMDTDGAVSIQAERLDEVLAAAEARFADEEEKRARFLAGERSFDSGDLRAIVAG